MSLSKKVVLTVSGYKISLSDSLLFYQNDQLKLIFEINKYGIDVASSLTHKTLMPLQPLTATLFIETPSGVDSIESANIEDNAVTFYLTSNQTQHVGTSTMQIKLTDDDGCQITLPSFTFEVQKNIYDNAVHVSGILLADENSNVLSDENGNTVNATATTETSKQIKDFTLKTGVSGQEDILVQDNGVTKRIKSNELIDTVDLTGYATETYVQNKITEASLSGGEVDLSGYATKDDLNTKADKSEIPSLEGYATETYVTNKIAEASLSGGEVDLSGLVTKDELATKADKTAIPIKTSQLTNDSGFLTAHQDISNLALKSELHSHTNKTVLDGITSTKVNEWNNKSNFNGDYNSLTNKPIIPTVPTKTSQLTNDSGFITSVPSEYITESELNTELSTKANISDIPSLTGYATETYVNDKLGDKSFIYLTQEEYNLLSDKEKQDGTKVYNITNATIDYSEISNTPTIPTKTSQLTNDSGFLTSDNLGVIKLTSPNGTKYKLIVNDDGSLSTELLGTTPCTSISLNTDTLSFTTSDNQTLIATPVPSNTTDTVLWSVSPKGIVSVSNGIVSPITNGSAVITATCGSQSATCNVNVNIESGGKEGSTYVFDCTPQSGTGLVHPIFLFDVNNALSTDTFSLSMDIQPVSNVFGIQNGIFSVNDVETVSDLTNSTNITKNCWVNNKDDSLISLNPTIPSITTDGRYAHVLIKIKPTSPSSKVQFKISNVQFKVNDRIINVSGYGTYTSGDSITIE